MASRFCSDCGKPAPASRCSACAMSYNAKRNAARPQYKNGWSSKAKKARAKQDWCNECGGYETPDDPFQADHIIPVAKGGTDAEDNLAPAHRSCNARKRDR